MRVVHFPTNNEWLICGPDHCRGDPEAAAVGLSVRQFKHALQCRLIDCHLFAC